MRLDGASDVLLVLRSSDAHWKSIPSLCSSECKRLFPQFGSHSGDMDAPAGSEPGGMLAGTCTVME